MSSPLMISFWTESQPPTVTPDGRVIAPVAQTHARVHLFGTGVRKHLGPVDQAGLDRVIAELGKVPPDAPDDVKIGAMMAL
jgi:hypothetical protein